MGLKPGTRLTFEWQDAQIEDWNCRPATAADLLDALDFPTDEDVEVAAKRIYGMALTLDDWDRIRAALLAVADARRTEEE